MKQLSEWKVSGVFGSHMVLQRNQRVHVWGFSSHIGTKVKGIWKAEKTESTVNTDGCFNLFFSARPADSTPSEMRIVSDYGETIFTDVLVGDVYLIGGQSNAELPLEPCLKVTPDFEKEIDERDPIRLFYQGASGAMEHKEISNEPCGDIIRDDWLWKKADRAAAGAFSAIGYYFAKQIQPIVGIPIGLIMICAGGACIRELAPLKLANALGYDRGANMPMCGYYNTLIHPFEGLAFRAQIFFQGESEGIEQELSSRYDIEMAQLIRDERERFGTDFPLYYFQISSYPREGIEFFKYQSTIRAKQTDALNLIPKSHMIVTRDMGSRPEDSDWAHSPHKGEHGRRLAAQVLCYEYGIGDEENVNAPMPVDVRHVGNALMVAFSHALKTIGGSHAVKGFSAVQPLEAELIDSKTIRVNCPETVESIGYAMTIIAGGEEANLYGINGLPVPTFQYNVSQLKKEGTL